MDVQSYTLPLVSVIIPNYNHALYLRQRLDSVFNQTYRNFEVIILDDCSTDNSMEIISRYKNNPHLSHIVANVTNSGNTFNQWNKGFSLAKGEIIWIAESDDYCELTMLDELVKAYISFPDIVLAYSTSIFINQGGMPLQHPKYKLGVKVFTGEDFVCRCMSTCNVVKNASSAIFSKKALINVRPDYQSYKGAGDYLFWVEIASQGRVARVDERLNYFRQTGASVTNKNFSSGQAAIEDMKVLQFIQSRYQLSWFHNRLAFASHSRLFKNVQYDSDEIKNKVYKLWKIHEYDSCLDYIMLRLRHLLIRFGNIYI